MIKDCLEWARDTFAECELGDKRLVNRLIKMGSYLAAKIGSNLSSCFKGNNTATVGAYRFIRNDQVKPEAIIEGICNASAKKIGDSDCILSIEDTTSVSYLHSVKNELGYTSNSNKENSAKGYFVHSVILYDPKNNKTLGLVDQNVWSRRSEEYGKHNLRKSKSYQEKESFKWESASNQVARRLGKNMSKVISVCDREADIFEYISYKLAHKQRFIVRAAQDRVIADSHESHISDEVMHNKALGTIEIKLSQRENRKARTATVELRAQTVKIKIPKSKSTGELEAIEINVVVATEILKSREKKLSWVLLTKEEIKTFHQVERVFQHYSKRWLIEEFHKCWKSGVKVEDRRMQTAANLKRMLVILAPIAIRLLQLRENLDDSGDKKSCLEVLNKDEFVVLWRTIEKKKIPVKKPSLNWAYRAIAKLAGWNDSKNTGKACWSTLWEGWYLLCHRVEGYLLSKELA